MRIVGLWTGKGGRGEEIKMEIGETKVAVERQYGGRRWRQNWALFVSLTEGKKKPRDRVHRTSVCMFTLRAVI